MICHGAIGADYTIDISDVNINIVQCIIFCRIVQKLIKALIPNKKLAKLRLFIATKCTATI